MASEQLWCKYYTGVHNRTCLQRHDYLNFNNGDDFGIIHKLPCLIRNGITDACPEFGLLTEAKEEENRRRGMAYLAKWIADKMIMEEISNDPKELETVSKSKLPKSQS